ncbi:SusC/RagA family TonB-linked outer membrane protein [Abyssalbus ytuae]|uniref:TonB-dependent receptor n=1 Tax=Abyssalbus ytuae TaxID=2926907 RepID=A0A9E6ZU21_9FLAO|nr:TonB-dependent receptor [Abyssalbus ytuae]UOB17803.1 TonB-dependent receptor [Abyssalbus ytuae]
MMTKKNKIWQQYVLFFFGILFFSHTYSFAQERNITGTVISGDDLQPLPGVSVVIKGTNTGIVTDFDGKYSITVNNNNDVLIFSYLGYANQEIAVGTKNQIDVTLKININELTEVIVIGYGSALRKDLTSSVSVVDINEMKTAPTPQFEQMLTGRVAGVDISSTNSEPGAGLKIRIRGNNSINGDNSPLLVIDGVLGGSFESLNVNDIESMQVLKDASATAIYGSQGANGVIIITTKQGKTGKLAVDLYTASGIQRVRKKLDLLTAEQHVQVLKDDPNFDFPEDISGIDNPILSGKGTDWQDEIFQEGLYQNYHLTLRGGEENLRGFLSLDYLDQEGVVKKSDYTKISGRANINFKASDKFSIRNNLSIYSTSTNQIKTNEGYGSQGGPVTINALLFSPIIPVYAEDGTYNGPLNAGYIRDNPIALINELKDLYETEYLQNTIFTKWKIFKGLTHDFSATYTNSTYNNKRYTGKVLLRSLNQGEAYLDNIERKAWQLKNTLTYKKKFNKNHDFSVLLGYEISKDERFRSRITVQGFATEAAGYNNIGIGSEVTSALSDKTRTGLVSYFSRITYGYKSKYLFSLSGRADGSTKFAENNKWGYFPSGSFAWVVSEENFLADSKTISFLKFRTSYGQTGSQAISPYQSLASYRTGMQFSYGDEDLYNGAFVNRVSNPNLKWETTTQFDLGVDLQLFDNRIGITADYFNKKTTDLLYDRRLLSHTGIDSQIQNIGEMENLGYEFSLNASVFDKKFKWDFSANISFIDNEVLDLGGDTDVYLEPPSKSRGSGFSTSGILTVGEPIGNFYGYVADGIFKTQEDLDAIEQDGAVLGSVRYKDISGPDGVPDGKIDLEYDRTVIGNALPDYIVGMTNNFSYNNFDLNVTLQASVGRDVIRFDKGRINTLEKFNGWSVNNPDTDIPTNGFLGDVTNSNYVEDASFLKFKNISLGYTFPKYTIEKLGLSNLKVYLSAIDAIVITDYSGYDPEVNSYGDGNSFEQNVSLGYDSGSYPGVSQYVLGINVSF